MIFSEQVLFTMDKAPDGWDQKLSLHDFYKLVAARAYNNAVLEYHPFGAQLNNIN